VCVPDVIGGLAVWRRHGGLAVWRRQKKKAALWHPSNIGLWGVHKHCIGCRLAGYPFRSTDADDCFYYRINSGLVPLIEDLCAQILYLSFEITMIDDCFYYLEQ